MRGLLLLLVLLLLLKSSAAANAGFTLTLEIAASVLLGGAALSAGPIKACPMTTR